MLPARKKKRSFDDLTEKPPKKIKFEKRKNDDAKPLKKIKLEDFKKTLGDKKEIPRYFKNQKGASGDASGKKSKPKFQKKDSKNIGNKSVEKQTKLCEMKWKMRKQERKKSESKVFEVSVKAKSIWELLRRDDCSKESKVKLLTQLMTLVQGHVKQLIFAHDTARVIECIVALGTEEHRNALFDELKDQILLLARSKYAKFFLIKLLTYGTKQQKDSIIKAMEGSIVSLIKHTEAAAVVECAYNEYANVKQRSAMTQEFYGPSFKFFKDATSTSLSELLSKDPIRKEEILNFMKPTLLRVLEKTVIRHSIVHHVLREYLEHADESGRSEITQALRMGLVEILHTKDGCRVAMACLWNGTTKDRKIILKSMKTRVVKIAKEEHGHLVLLAAFDSVDDIKLIEKIVVPELIRGCLEVSDDQFGRKVLLYLLSPRDGRYFHPDVVNILKRGDGNPHSKKSVDIRQEELRQCMSGELLKFVAENVEHLLSTNPTCMLLLAILKHASGDTTDALKSLIQLLMQPYHKPSGEDVHLIEHAGLSFVCKKIMKESSKEKNDNAQLFALLLIETVPKGVPRTWVECNRGAFLLLNLLETNIPKVVSRMKKELNSVKTLLASKDYKGGELLLKKLNE